MSDSNVVGRGSESVAPTERVKAPLAGVIAVADPFTYSVHAFKNLLLKNTGFEAITYDLGFLLLFSVVAMTAATALFKRTL